MKTKKLLSILAVILTTVSLTACQLPFINVIRGSGNLISETREVSSFSEIRLDGAGRLFITQGTDESLEIEAEDNIIGELTSEVQGDTLVLGYQDKPWATTVIPTNGITYTLTVVDLTGITFNGAGDLELSSLDTSSLAVEINGAGQMDIDALRADNLSVLIAGTGTISVGGQVSSQDVIIDGAGNYQAGDLETVSTSIEINGIGNGTVWATDSLEINIDGGGTLNYYGTPSVTQDINGLADINNRGEK